jgi:hypothetical protein
MMACAVAERYEVEGDWRVVPDQRSKDNKANVASKEGIEVLN